MTVALALALAALLGGAEGEVAPAAPAPSMAAEVEAPSQATDAVEPEALPQAGVEPDSEGTSELEDLSLFFSEDELVELPTRKPQKLREAPGIVSVVTRQQIADLGARDLTDVLGRIPGLAVTRDPSGFWRVTVRGLRKDPGVLVMIDGVRTNDPYDGRALLALPVEMIERVEVVRGPGSALWGTSALVAMINVVTRRDPGVRVTARGGEYDTLRVATDVATEGPTRAHAFVSYAATDGVRTRAPDDRGSVEHTTTLAPGVLADDASTFTLNADLEHTPVGRLLPLVALRVRRNVERRGAHFGKIDVFGPDGRLEEGQILTSLEVNPTLGDWQLGARVALDQIEVDRLYQERPPGFRTQLSVFPDGVFEQQTYRANTATLGLNATRSFESNELSFGLDVERLGMGSFELLRNRQGDLYRPGPLQRWTDTPFEQDGRTRWDVGGWVQERVTLLETVDVTGGLRFDHFTDFGSTLNPRLGVVWRALEWMNVKALAATAFRAPTFEELYDTTDFQGGYIGNPDLEPERIQSVELGADAHLTPDGMLLDVRVNGFYSRLVDDIERFAVGGGPNSVPIENGNGVDGVGGEGELRLEWTRRNYAYVQYSLAWARADAPPGGTASVLRDQSRHRVNAGVHVEREGLGGAAAALAWGSERRNNRRTPLESTRLYRLAPYYLVDLTVHTPRLGPVVLAGTLFNVLDADHADDAPRPQNVPRGIPREGRMLLVTASVETDWRGTP